MAEDTDGKRACVVGCNRADRAWATRTARVPKANGDVVVFRDRDGGARAA